MSAATTGNFCKSTSMTLELFEQGNSASGATHVRAFVGVANKFKMMEGRDLDPTNTDKVRANTTSASENWGTTTIIEAVAACAAYEAIKTELPLMGFESNDAERATSGRSKNDDN